MCDVTIQCTMKLIGWPMDLGKNNNNNNSIYLYSTIHPELKFCSEALILLQHQHVYEL